MLCAARRRDREEVERGNDLATSRTQPAGARWRSRSSAPSSRTDAVTAWKGVLHHPGLQHKPYEGPLLVHFNYRPRRGPHLERGVDRGAAGDRREPAQARARSPTDFEAGSASSSARSTCFQILLKLGKESRAVREPRRGLRQLHPRAARRQPEDSTCQQYYEDFIKLALERAELHAAATLYCQERRRRSRPRAGLPYDRHYQHKSALTWMPLRRQVRRDRRARADDRERAARPRRRSTARSATTRGARVAGRARWPRAHRPPEEAVPGDRGALQGPPAPPVRPARGCRTT